MSKEIAASRRRAPGATRGRRQVCVTSQRKLQDRNYCDFLLGCGDVEPGPDRLELLGESRRGRDEFLEAPQVAGEAGARPVLGEERLDLREHEEMFAVGLVEHLHVDSAMV